MLNDAQVQAYLDRIGYNGSLGPSLDNLRALQRAHVFSVPFENLDIHLGQHMPVDVAHAYRKVVDRHRGGFCYELNPLFHALLSTLGYHAKIVSARILLRDDGHPFDHIATVVHLDDDWLVDVGYGRQPPAMRIAPSVELSNENGTFKLQYVDGEFVVMGSKDNGDYEASYGFRLIPRDLREFEERSNWVQTSPDSIFTKAPICTLPVGDGRTTISGLNFIRSRQGEVESRKITPKERIAILWDVFGIDLGDEELQSKSDLSWIPGRGL
jgi:N-hydroxyarylamine O-acetyltransferase